MTRYTSQELIQGIVQECHAQFTRLPKHGKPAKKSNGQAEWTILAGIMLVTPQIRVTTANDDNVNGNSNETNGSWEVECISLATGSKCLPQGKLSPRGDLVNDCHAEVLARRGFNRWCLSEMQASIRDPSNAKNKFRYVGDQERPLGEDPSLFELADPRMQFHLYVSQAPCGDATTASLAHVQTAESRSAFLSGQQSQAKAHASVKEQREAQVPGSKRQRDPTVTEANDMPPSSKQPKLAEPTADVRERELETMSSDSSKQNICGHALGFRRGRINYDCVGVLRTKPGRVDSEPTLSMSCSDKIARWNILGLTSALVAPFTRPIYLHSIVTRELFDAEALERALFNRINTCDPHHIAVYESTIAFEFSKAVVTGKSDQESVTAPPVASSSSISWIASEPTATEVLVNGCKAGASTKNAVQPKSRSRLCKLSMFKTSVALWKSLPASALKRSWYCDLVFKAEAESLTYSEWKNLDEKHSAAKESLFQGVFRNWVRSDRTLEMFKMEVHDQLKSR